MGQTKSTFPTETSESTRFAKAEKIDVILASAIKPNGNFPAELICEIMNSTDVHTTCCALALSCKMYYEVFLGTTYGGNLQLARANMAKGLFWSETLSTRFMPNWVFAYIASFQRNKVLVNNHSFMEASLGVCKVVKVAFIMDLTTMTKITVPYGCVFAHDYFLMNTRENGEHFFDWDTLEVLDKNLNSLHSIARKNKVPQPQFTTSELDSPLDIVLLQVNQKSGEDTIILYNSHLKDTSYGQYLDDFIDRKVIVEVYHLKSGNLILESKIDANRILSYYGNYIVMIRKQRVIAFDLRSKHEVRLSSDCNNAAVYINNDEIGLVENSKFKVFSLSELREIRIIDLKPILTSVKEEGRIQALAFDDYKLVVTYALSGAIIHFVVSLSSGTLITSMHTPYDRNLEKTVRPKVHVTPNGKIVTDAFNLTVYDFVHPKVNPNPELTVSALYFKDGKAEKFSIRLSELSKFSMKKLNTTFNKLRTRTINNVIEGRQYRATVIFREHEDDTFVPPNQLFLTVFSQWKADEQRRCVWQLTLTDPTQVVNQGYYCSTYKGDYEQAVPAPITLVVFEEFNSKKNQWEFCEPCVDVSKPE